jgi:hypothetical protein
VENEVDFIGNIGNAQMDHMIMEKVLKIERNISEKLREKDWCSFFTHRKRNS